MTDNVSKQELETVVDKLLILHDKTNERITALENSISRQFSFWGITITVIAVLFAGMQIGIALALYYLK